MRNPTASIIADAAARFEAGEKMKDILADTDLNYSQVWDAWAIAKAAELGLAVDAAGKSDTELSKIVVAMRDEVGEHSSWGWIMARLGLREGRVRKLYSMGTNVHTEGLRIGKGGRFVQDEARYYATPEATKVGSVCPIGEARKFADAADVERRARLGQMKYQDLRKMAKDAGYTKANASKAELVQYLVPRITLKDEAPAE